MSAKRCARCGKSHPLATFSHGGWAAVVDLHTQKEEVRVVLCDSCLQSVQAELAKRTAKSAMDICLKSGLGESYELPAPDSRIHCHFCDSQKPPERFVAYIESRAIDGYGPIKHGAQVYRETLPCCDSCFSRVHPVRKIKFTIGEEYEGMVPADGIQA